MTDAREVVLCDDHVHDCPYLLKQVRRIEEENERLRAELDSYTRATENLANKLSDAEDTIDRADEHTKMLMRKIEELEAENERLRIALDNYKSSLADTARERDRAEARSRP